jgi:hypothetical protein
MEICPLLLPWLRRLALCTVIGTAALVLSVVLVKVAVVAAVFALVGCLLWMPLHTVFRGPHSSWRCAKRGCHDAGRCCRTALERVEAFAAGWWPRVWGVAVESFCGAAVAMALVLLAGMDGPVVAIAGAVGMIAGAVLGAARR